MADETLDCWALWCRDLLDTCEKFVRRESDGGSAGDDDAVVELYRKLAFRAILPEAWPDGCPRKEGTAHEVARQNEGDASSAAGKRAKKTGRSDPVAPGRESCPSGLKNSEKEIRSCSRRMSESRAAGDMAQEAKGAWTEVASPNCVYYAGPRLAVDDRGPDVPYQAALEMWHRYRAGLEQEMKDQLRGDGEESTTLVRCRGEVLEFRTDRGWGFIQDAGYRHYNFNRNAVVRTVGPDWDNPEVGEEVLFTPMTGPRGPWAAAVARTYRKAARAREEHENLAPAERVRREDVSGPVVEEDNSKEVPASAVDARITVVSSPQAQVQPHVVVTTGLREAVELPRREGVRTPVPWVFWEKLPDGTVQRGLWQIGAPQPWEGPNPCYTQLVQAEAEEMPARAAEGPEVGAEEPRAAEIPARAAEIPAGAVKAAEEPRAAEVPARAVEAADSAKTSKVFKGVMPAEKIRPG